MSARTVFLTLTIVGAAASGYFSYENKVLFEKTIADRLSYQEKFAETEKILRVQEGERAKMEKLRDIARDDMNLAEANITQAQTKQSELKREDSQVSQMLAKAKGELDTLNNQLAEMAKAVGNEGVTFDTLPGAIKDLEDDVRDKNTKNEELKVVRAEALKKVQGEEAEIARRQGIQSDWRATVRQNGTEAIISAVNHDWNFVVINLGESDKIDPTAPLIVTRNGKRIAQLRIVSIEKNQTIADIVPNSIRNGDQIVPGDTVILRNPQG